MLEVQDKGLNNKIVGSFTDDSDLTVNFSGDNNTLKLGPRVSVSRGLINFRGSNQIVELAGQNKLILQVHLSGLASSLYVGLGTCSNGAIWMNLGEEGDRVEIGQNCLFSAVRFRTSDSHPIYDALSGERINPSADIHIGDRVWLAEDVLVLKGAVIGSGSAVGARAVVTGTLPEACLAVGIPARAVRSSIRWAETF